MGAWLAFPVAYFRKYKVGILVKSSFESSNIFTDKDFITGFSLQIQYFSNQMRPYTNPVHPTINQIHLFARNKHDFSIFRR